MDAKRNFWVVGGDRRQASLARLLAEDGHTVRTYALDRAEDLDPAWAGDLEEARLAHCVILPLPAVGEGGCIRTPLGEAPLPMTRLLDALCPGQVVCAGKAEDGLVWAAQERGLRLFDYFAREELAVANAVPTAEGAVQIALEELPVTLHGARVLVLGFGRVGKLTAHRFAALGAGVTVCARKWADLAWAGAWGYAALPLWELDGGLGGYDLVVNTVPAQLLTPFRLAALDRGCLVMDLASEPGGVDLGAAAELGIRAIWARALPGKVAPVTAGQIIRDAVYHILDELGD